jgi:hypothetical protein
MTMPANPVARLQRLQALTVAFMEIEMWAVRHGGPWLEELEELIGWALESEDPPADVAEAFRGTKADLALFRAFVKAATPRPDSSAARALVSDGEPGGVLPDRGR